MGGKYFVKGVRCAEFSPPLDHNIFPKSVPSPFRRPTGDATLAMDNLAAHAQAAISGADDRKGTFAVKVRMSCLLCVDVLGRHGLGVNPIRISARASHARLF
jgi:hypothetical protein